MSIRPSMGPAAGAGKRTGTISRTPTSPWSRPAIRRPTTTGAEYGTGASHRN
ncbi:MAG: hypothetical protein Q9210_003811, partial [Variospora velana]